MRGSPLLVDIDHLTVGIIPAGAGLTLSSFPVSRSCRDHPRGCGAHVFNSPADIGGWGSSPRVRGSHAFLFCFFPLLGIIPAGAGLTISSLSAVHGTRDHPRGCGAHGFPSKLPMTRKGSSPRVRGSPCTDPLSCLLSGIIPAGAGLTYHINSGQNLQRDHPRGCGAHFPFLRALRYFVGSSPRVRGSPQKKATKATGTRIIPAGAGLTCRVPSTSLPRWDHPRGCGAHVYP